MNFSFDKKETRGPMSLRVSLLCTYIFFVHILPLNNIVRLVNSMSLNNGNKNMQAKAAMEMPEPLTKQQIEDLRNEEDITDFLGEIAMEEELKIKFQPGVGEDGTELFFYPYGNRPKNMDTSTIPIIPVPKETPQFSYIRFLNENPYIGSVDIYINGKLFVSNQNYQEFTEYMKVLPGSYRIVVFKAGTQENPLNVSRISVRGGRIYTAVLVGTADDVFWELVVDNRRTLNPNIAYIRFIQLSPNAPLMDVYVDERLVISDLDYREISRYLTLLPGEHSIKLKAAMSDRLLLVDPSLVLKGGRSYSVYIVGDMNTSPGLQVLIPLEGVSYLEF